MRLAAALLAMLMSAAPAQTPAVPGVQASVSAADLAAAIPKLGSFDFPTRSAASRTVRRADASVAVPALVSAVHTSADSYVQFRALVLLAGFGDAAAGGVMRSVLGDRNDRLRAVAYQWFEQHPDPALLPQLLEALPHEPSEFVQPQLLRALAAQGNDPRVQKTLLPLVSSGQDYFRGEVIQALGDAKAMYARDAVLAVAKLDGPLQEDALIALGKIGDASVIAGLADLQASAPRERQPAIAAATWLLGVSRPDEEAYLVSTLTYAAGAEDQDALLRASAHALGALAIAGDRAALEALVEVGIASHEPARTSIALATGIAAIRNPALLLDVMSDRSDLNAASDLLRDGFDTIEDDFLEEEFYVAIRRAYWAAPESSARRNAAATLIQVLEF